MDAHGYLMQIRDYDIRLTNLRDEIDSLYARAAGVSSMPLAEKVQTSPSGGSPQENFLPKIYKEIRMYEDTYNRYLRLRKRIVDQINRMPDWRHKRILYLTYIKGWHSPQIADELCYTCEWTRKLRSEALMAFWELFLQDGQND